MTPSSQFTTKLSVRKKSRPTAAPVPPPKSPKGVTAIVAAATAILGVLTAIWPNVPVLETMIEVVPELEVAIPLVLTSVGAIVAAATKPPRVG